MASKDKPQKGNGPPKDDFGVAAEGIGIPADSRMVEGERPKTLTTRQGHPVTDNQNVRTVGPRGPVTLENYHFLEKITHFDRERIPERVVHARGAGAHGVFEAYGKAGDEPIAKYTRAKLFQTRGKQTPVFVRFSSVIHGGHSPETLRDPVKFPDLVHAFKPDPVTNRQDGQRIFDFISHHPEAIHMITFLFSPWGIPANYRQMQGSGVNTYKWVNANGDAVLVKYHWEPISQGIRNLTQDDAEAIQAKNFNHASQDLYEAIEAGNYPEWELCVQLMSDDEHAELDFSDDKLLQGRTLSYSDTQRYRLGTNYLQLPINAPKKHVATNLRDGQMAFYVDTAPGQNRHVNYEPSLLNGLSESPRAAREHTPQLEGRLVRERINPRDDYKQAGARYRMFADWERDELIRNLANTLAPCDPLIQTKMIEHFTNADPEYGHRVAEALQAAMDEMQEESGQPIGAHEAHRATKAAARKGHPARPY